MGDDQYLCRSGEPGQPATDLHGSPAPDPGIHLIEDEGRHSPVPGLRECLLILLDCSSMCRRIGDRRQRALDEFTRGDPGFGKEAGEFGKGLHAVFLRSCHPA